MSGGWTVDGKAVDGPTVSGKTVGGPAVGGKTVDGPSVKGNVVDGPMAAERRRSATRMWMAMQTNQKI